MSEPSEAHHNQAWTAYQDCDHTTEFMVCDDCVAKAIAAAEERGRRRGVEEERKRAMTVVHILHQCIRGKCACASEENGALSQFACEATARKAIDAWTDLAPRDSGKDDRISAYVEKGYGK